MKKKKIKLLCLSFAAGLLLSCTACEKKAELIEDYNGESGVGGAADSSKESDDINEDNEKRTSDGSELATWNEEISVNGDGFKGASVAASISSVDLDELSTVTVEMNEFNKEYIKNMCNTVFDSGKVEVYDYNAKTQRVYDDLISVYEDALAYCEEESGKRSSSAFDYFPQEYHTDGYWSIGMSTEKFDKEQIRIDIERLKNERESAPVSIENDYSYQGYIGKINGEEYYMYFGNRNYDEYPNSQETNQFNGRVITIMKKNLTGAYVEQPYYALNEDGEPIEVMTSEGCDENGNPIAESIFFKKDSIVSSDSIVSTTTVDGEATDEVENDMKSVAENFLFKLGYGDYTFNEEKVKTLVWGNSLNPGFFYINDYNMYAYSLEASNGYILRYDLDQGNTERLMFYDILPSSYVKDGDALDYNSHINIMVNENGVVGCQIYNPTHIMKIDNVSGILDLDSIKEVVRDSVDDKNLWNIPSGIDSAYVNIDRIKLVNFPLKSKDSKEEYTFVPCYVIFKKLTDETTLRAEDFQSEIPYSSDVDNPFLIINAIDGSIIKVADELDDYPKGWNNGNTGYMTYVTGTWYRFTKLSEREN